MRWRNDREQWGVVTRTLHWGTALLILIEVPAGFVMSRTYGAKDPVLAAWQFWSSNFHHSAGLVLLMLAFGRALWRLAGPVPQAPAAQPPAPQRRDGRTVQGIARVTHWLLYALLILIPLSGWAALSSLADTAQFVTHFWFFGTDGFGPHGIILRIVPAVPWNSEFLFRYGVFASAHRWLLIAGAGLLTLHILAALRHHLVLRDATLRRMLTGSAPPVG